MEEKKNEKKNRIKIVAEGLVFFYEEGSEFKIYRCTLERKRGPNLKGSALARLVQDLLTEFICLISTRNLICDLLRTRTEVILLFYQCAVYRIG